jgi:hypothetical protein
VEVGSCVAVGLVGADDGGADDGGTVAVGVGVTDGLVGAEGLAEGLAVALGAAELLVGAGAGGPKQPESPSRAQSPRTLNAESPGLAMTPPWMRARVCRTPPSTYAEAALPTRDLSPTSTPAPARTASGARSFLLHSGVIYLVLFVYELVVPQDSAGNFVPLNSFDNILHLLLGIGVVALALILTRGHGKARA